MIKPELLKVFIRLCETRSFTITAEGLHIPRSTVSDSIKRLELELGVKLVQRTTRKVQVTDEGRILYEKALSLMDGFIELEALFHQQSEGRLQGRIRVDMPIGLSRNIIMKALPEFLEMYPDLNLEISSSDRRVDLIAEGFDFVIRVGSMRDSSLIARKIGEHKLINCIGKKYIEKYGIPRTLRDLKNHFQIHYLQNLGVGKDSFEYLEGTKYFQIETKSLLTVNNSIAYTDACLAGLGIIQVPILGVKHLLETGDLVQVLKKYEAEPMGVYFVYPNREHVPLRVKIFMEWCEEILKKHL